ncbi:MAG: DUF2760 domain-containing protein [Desulfobacterales bacterium]|nr:DUF2760 domain-containing protein [Desulfobacterales bacterium]
MDRIQKFSNCCLLWAFVGLLILGGLIGGGMHWKLAALKRGLSQHPEQLNRAALDLIMPGLLDLGVTHWQILAAGLVVTALFLWLSFRLSLKRVPPEQLTASRVAPPRAAVEPSGRRQTLLLLSLLQREGRLVDFLKEDLQDYDDAQIGAAVRSIQENCKKSLERYLDPQAVIDETEGETITVPTGFDAGAVKLTGNVSGRPPFKGILQHRGWKVGRFDLPQLSGTVTPDIIAPAEVEVL